MNRHRGLVVCMLVVALVLACFVVPVAAEYVSLVDSTFLDGPKADLQTAGTSFLTLVAILAGIGLLVRALLR